MHVSSSVRPEWRAYKEILKLSYALDEHKSLLGAYPSASDWVEQLEGRYVPAGATLDPWGQPYQYQFLGADPNKPFALFSFGQDGVTGTEGNDADDIRLWGENVVLQAGPREATSKIVWRLLGIFGVVLGAVIATAVVQQRIIGRRSPTVE